MQGAKYIPIFYILKVGSYFNLDITKATFLISRCYTTPSFPVSYIYLPSSCLIKDNSKRYPSSLHAIQVWYKAESTYIPYTNTIGPE